MMEEALSSSTEDESRSRELSQAEAPRLQEESAARAKQLGVARPGVDLTHRALALLAHPALLPPLGADALGDVEDVARALVDTLCDGCTVDLTGPEGVQCVAAAHTRPALAAKLRDVVHRDSIWGLGSPALRIPLGADDVGLGLMTIWCEQTRTFEPSELKLVHWVARHLSALLENRRLQAKLEDAANASDTLLSMVSHELRTPLATMSMSVDASILRIEASADELPKSWLLQRLHKVKKAVQRTDRLLHTFLGASQIQSGRLTPDVRDVDVAALVTSAVNTLADELAWAGCACELSAPRPEVGRWDPVQLEIVVMNLLTNAMKYAPGAAVQVEVEGRGEEVVLSVRDQGPGISRELRARLFQRFSRLPTSSRVHGFGLGLWIVKHFVEANGGNVSCVSEPGQGTTFRVCLPRSGGAPKPARSA